MASFKNSYQYEWRDTADMTSKVKLYQNAALPLTLSFTTPRLICRGCLSEGGSWSDLFEMNVKTTVYREEMRLVERAAAGMHRYEIVPNTRTVYKTFESGATSIPDANNAVYYASGGIAYLRRITSNSATENSKNAGNWTNYYTTTSALARVPQGTNSKTISFNVEALTEQELEAGKAYMFTIECAANPINTSAMLSYYEAMQTGTQNFKPAGLVTIINYSWQIYTREATVVDATSIKVIAAFNFQDFSVVTSGGALITKGVKYSCYDLLRKALLTCDTYLIDNDTTSLDEYDNLGAPQPSLQHSIVLDEAWNNRLKTAKMQETIFEQKNLWEVLLQIGYYIHAIPYLDFATDGTDRFALKFKQLGDTKMKSDGSNKITVFNSRNLSEFFTQYDSYVTNLFSPQNLVDEWVVPKTSDSTYLVSNNTAELQLTYGMTEIIDFDISMKLPNGVWDTRSALENLFEKSIYDILSNDNPYQVYPCKGAALYYTLGDSKIQGLNFVPPSANPGLPMALKRIVQIVWQGTTIGDIAKLRYNELKFHVKYRTQDTVRLTQVRPDLQNFMKNSSYESYPHHEQYFGQQDKIIDSERFSANLFGKLIRVGNAIYQRQECADDGSEKESGDLVSINGDDYYVTAVENEYYADTILQKVTYSKNFNQLANIVTIPSEPRFYEVSERSKIRREMRIMEFFELSTAPPSSSATPRYLNSAKWKDFIKNLIFNKNTVTLPNYAFTRFKADKKRTHTDSNGFGITNDKLFPSSLLDRTSPNAVSPKPPSDHSDCIVPVLHYPLHDGIVFEWDMVDNFKAGDFVDSHEYSTTTNDDDAAYLSMQPFRYVDVLGRADLMTFRLFSKTDWTFEQAQKLPQAIVSISDSDSIVRVPGGENWGIALDKDCREEMSFNYQINLLHRQTPTEANDFFTFPNLFGQKESPLKVCLLSEPQSLFNENINLSAADTLDDDVGYSFYDASNGAIGIRFTPKATTNLQQVKAVVFYEESAQGNRNAYIVKNISALTVDGKLPDWYIYAVYNS